MKKLIALTIFAMASYAISASAGEPVSGAKEVVTVRGQDMCDKTWPRHR